MGASAWNTTHRRRHRLTALQVMFREGVVSTSGLPIDELLDDIANAMGLWAFPAQDDADFKLPEYDTVK